MKQGNRPKPDRQVEKQADRSVNGLSSLQAGRRQIETAGRNKTCRQIVGSQLAKKPKSRQVYAKVNLQEAMQQNSQIWTQRQKEHDQGRKNCGLVEFCWV
jgi:methylmalonyl-CoA mutase N-terminal domain/subunit